jgi:hypothetical protein
MVPLNEAATLAMRGECGKHSCRRPAQGHAGSEKGDCRALAFRRPIRELLNDAAGKSRREEKRSFRKITGEFCVGGNSYLCLNRANLRHEIFESHCI